MTSAAHGTSSSWSTGGATRVAKVPEGSSNTGILLIVASAAPVSMFVEPGPDRRGARPRRETVPLPGVGDGGVDHGLLVAGQDVGQPLVVRREQLVLEEGLTDAGNVAVAEDAEAPGKEAPSLAVPLGPLLSEEAHHGLSHGESDGLGGARHRASPSGSRGSIGWPGQVSRTQPWSGSSQISQARSGPGPAMTLR